jgi:hypothetical protein
MGFEVGHQKALPPVVKLNAASNEPACRGRNIELLNFS